METIRKEDIITELEKWIGYHYCGVPPEMFAGSGGTEMANVVAIADRIRQLKKDKVQKEMIMAEVEKLKAAKAAYEEVVGEAYPDKPMTMNGQKKKVLHRKQNDCSVNISKLIQKYETFFGESPDIESIIQKYYDNWNISEKMSDIKYKPKFSKHLSTKYVHELYRNVKENCSKEYIESKLSNSIIANFIVNSPTMYTEEITYLYMVESLKKVWNSYSIEYAPSPAPAPSPEQTNSVIHAVPLSQTRENEIDTLKKRVEILEKKNEELFSIIAEIKQKMNEKNEKCAENSNKPDLHKKHITKIESKAGQLVDKISFYFEDGEDINYGGGGGSYLENFILKKNEKIIKVKQYIDYKYNWKTNKFLGYRIDFETNHQRSYKISSLIAYNLGWRGKNGDFKPHETDYHEKNYISFNISPNKELIGLKFNNGKLIGIEEN